MPLKHKFYFFWVIFLGIILAFGSCQSDTIQIEGVSVWEIADCFAISEEELIVNDSITYQTLTAAPYTTEPCANYKAPVFNFEQYTLLSKITNSTGCDINYRYEAYADPTASQYICNIIATSSIPNCGSIETKRHWISVAKLPEHYSVAFMLKEE